jgi:hypothetical protein
MGFQDPLVLHNTPSCNIVCNTVAKATEFFPPHLTSRNRSAALRLTGSWVSQRCETRAYGIFMTRHFEFVDADRKWVGRHNYFADVTCKRHLYTLDTAGDYKLEQTSSDLVHNAYNIDFNVSGISLAVFDKAMLRQLNEVRSCGDRASDWRSGQMQDVTNTTGCPAIGITVATSESDIVRVEQQQRPQPQRLLWLGQRPTDNSPDQRPTSFQPALADCASVPAELPKKSGGSGVGDGGAGSASWSDRQQQQQRAEHHRGSWNSMSAAVSVAMFTAPISCKWLAVVGFVFWRLS